MSTHTLSVLVENKPGVLTRVAGLFARRGFNIESLAVGPTEHAEISRITILVSVEGTVLEQVTKQLNKLVNVLKIVELEQSQAVQRELLLVKVRADESPLEQVTKQLNKLVNVIKIVELDPAVAVRRELLLVKVRADATVRSQVLETVQLFRAKVVDVSPEALTVEATGTADKLEALLRMLEPFGVREMVQSGMVAIGRGPRSITAAAVR